MSLQPELRKDSMLNVHVLPIIERQSCDTKWLYEYPVPSELRSRGGSTVVGSVESLPLPRAC